MEVVHETQLNIYAIIMLIIIYFNIKFDDPTDLRERYFPALVISAILAASLETITFVIDGMNGLLVTILLYGLNILVITLVAAPVVLWFLYVDFEIHRESRKTLKLEKHLKIYILIILLLVATSVFTGWVFYIDSTNTYVRGPLFAYMASFNYVLVLIVLFKLFYNRKRLDRRQIIPLSTFIIPAILGASAQLIVYGTTTAWPGVALSILILFLFIKNYIIHTDYLTKLSSRKTIHEAITRKIEQNETFAAVMIDMDGFKTINDTFGHVEGNIALKTVANILKKSFDKNDIVGRYAGDEFVVVFNVLDETDMENKMENLRNAIKEYNKNSGKEYELRFSMGYDLFDSKRFKEFHYFIEYIDSLMYTKKRRRKRISEHDYE